MATNVGNISSNKTLVPVYTTTVDGGWGGSSTTIGGLDLDSFQSTGNSDGLIALFNSGNYLLGWYKSGNDLYIITNDGDYNNLNSSTTKIIKQTATLPGNASSNNSINAFVVNKPIVEIDNYFIQQCSNYLDYTGSSLDSDCSVADSDFIYRRTGNINDLINEYNEIYIIGDDIKSGSIIYSEIFDIFYRKSGSSYYFYSPFNLKIHNLTPKNITLYGEIKKKTPTELASSNIADIPIMKFYGEKIESQGTFTKSFIDTIPSAYSNKSALTDRATNYSSATWENLFAQYFTVNFTVVVQD